MYVSTKVDITDVAIQFAMALLVGPCDVDMTSEDAANMRASSAMPSIDMYLLFK